MTISNCLLSIPDQFDWSLFFTGTTGGILIIEFILGKRIDRPILKSIAEMLLLFTLILVSAKPIQSAIFLAIFIALIALFIRLGIGISVKIKKETNELKLKIENLIHERDMIKIQLSELQKKIECQNNSFSLYSPENELMLIKEQVELITDNEHLLKGLVPVEQALNYILDRMMNTVLHSIKPEQYRVCVAEPLESGNFHVLASRNTLFERILAIERDADWKKGCSLFAAGVHSVDRWMIIPSENPRHYDFKLPQNDYVQSSAHLIIPITHGKYRTETGYKRCLAVLTIGALEANLIENPEKIYDNLKPQLFGIEFILKHYRDYNYLLAHDNATAN